MRSNEWRQLAEKVTSETDLKKMNELIDELNRVMGERDRDERIALTRNSPSLTTTLASHSHE
jgi:2-oxo-4-hydroxy-4-carboxy--5-ureidoimidazoline (OHCU) decarboxylase